MNTVFINILIIYIVLLTVVLTILRLIDRNFQKMQILEEGRECAKSIQKVRNILEATNSFIWGLEDGVNVTLGEYFFKSVKMRERTIPLEAIMRCLPENERNTLSYHLENATEDGTSIELNFRIPMSGIHHSISAYICSSTLERKQITNGMFIVIDDLKKEEEDLRNAFNLDEENKMKASFLASMGHEIRNPLNIITGFSKLLIRDYNTLPEDERQNYFQIIEDSNNQLLKLMGDVLNGSTKDGVELELVLRTKQVSELVEELYTTNSIMIPDRLSFSLTRGVEDAFIDINRSSMLQIVSNIINNAIKFTEKGGITMGWDCTDDTVIVYIADTGIGIPKENQEKIFSKYFKENAGAGGAGIGLSLCARLMSKMHGKIQVHSVLGQGSRFELLFPRKN